MIVDALYLHNLERLAANDGDIALCQAREDHRALPVEQTSSVMLAVRGTTQQATAKLATDR